MPRLSRLFILLLTLITFRLQAYKILYFSPRFSGSHVTFIGNIADTLAEAGHNVTILMTEMNPFLTMNGSKLAKVIMVPPVEDAASFFLKDDYVKKVWKKEFSLKGLLESRSAFSKAFVATCENLNDQKDLLTQLEAEKFDLAMTEVSMLAPWVSLIKLLKIPAHVITSSSSLMDSLASMIGIPLFPSFVPATFSKSTDQMSYVERFVNFLAMMVAKIVFNGLVDSETQLYKRLYGDDFPDLMEIVAQSSFVLTNGEPLLDFPHLITSKVVEIGGLSVPAPKPLEEYWESVIHKRSKVILVSFGSIAQSRYMPQEYKKAMLEAFALFPDISFIWKYESDDLNLNNYPNVIIGKWLPQNDLLNDPRVVAFITHAGMNSVIESAMKGVPMITIPLFAEQNRNAALVRKAKIGLKLRVINLDKMDILAESISVILNDRSYAENAKRLARMIAKKPMTSKFLLVKHVEFAAEFGRLPNLDPVGRTMPFYMLYMLDIFVPLLIAAIFFCISAIFAFYKIAVWILKRVRRVKVKLL